MYIVGTAYRGSLQSNLKKDMIDWPWWTSKN